MARSSTESKRHQKLLSIIERNCDISFIRENMLLATVKDGGCSVGLDEVFVHPQ
jgi:hypothetical protein